MFRSLIHLYIQPFDNPIQHVHCELEILLYKKWIIMLDLSQHGFVDFHPLFPQSITPALAFLFLIVSFLSASIFFIKQVGTNKYSRNICQEILFAVIGSLSFGFGLVFMFLAVGIYV
ncbi:hypothetical protein QVD99_8722 [Batrachochytrium dendrobatidis]|nr:hypothetical protein QVD99_8722 [Batrachochytrium dendrobatidis]